MNNELKKTLNSILERLDNIEERLSVLELAHQPIQPVNPHELPKLQDFDWQTLIVTSDTIFTERE